MKMLKTTEKKEKVKQIVLFYGEEILKSKSMQNSKKFIQHGKVSVYEHSLSVACLAVYIASFLPIQIDLSALIRGALLHDYFLYDWHIPNKSYRLHGFRHAKIAATNAKRDFLVGPIEEDIITKHMFPLNLKPPIYRESIIVCISDKICATLETIHRFS